MKQIFLMGPTASGKTDIAMALQDRFNLKIVSVDSAQIYKECNIGTAKPSITDQNKYPHSLINLINPDENFSVKKFLKEYDLIVKNEKKDDKIPFFVGGTMLYFNSIFRPLDDIPQSSEAIRCEVHGLMQANGIEWLADIVKKVDPASLIKRSDRQRLQRSYEVFLMTGKPLTSFYRSKNQEINNPTHLKLALMPEDRKKLHNSIKKRTEIMLKNGLVDEVQDLLKNYPKLTDNSNILRSVGYRQVMMYLNGKIKHEDLFDKILFATRQLAKRQITWLRSMNNITFFDPYDSNVSSKISNRLNQFIN